MFFKERMTYKKWLGLSIGLLGFTPLLIANESQSDADWGIFSLAGLAMLFAVIFNTYGYIILRYLVKKRNYSPIHITALSLVIAGTIMAIVSWMVEIWAPTPFTTPHIFFGYVVLVVILGNIFSYNLYVFLLKKYTATFVAFASSLFPLFGAFFGWLFFKEVISWQFLVALIFVAVGLSIFYRAEQEETLTE